jgi:hypothetical protein
LIICVSLGLLSVFHAPILEKFPPLVKPEAENLPQPNSGRQRVPPVSANGLPACFYNYHRQTTESQIMMTASITR